MVAGRHLEDGAGGGRRHGDADRVGALPRRLVARHRCLVRVARDVPGHRDVRAVRDSARAHREGEGRHQATEHHATVHPPVGVVGDGHVVEGHRAGVGHGDVQVDGLALKDAGLRRADHRRQRRPAHQQDRQEGVAHLVGPVAPVGGVALPQLALVVLAPALHAAVVQAGATRGGSGGHGGRRAPRPELYHRQGVPHLARGVPTGGGVPQAQLAEVVATPALDGAVVQPGAGVEPARRQAGGEEPSAQHDWRQGRHLAGFVAAGERVALTQLAVGVLAPALHGAVVEDGARVHGTGGDRRRCVPPAQVHRRQLNAHLVGLVTTVLRVADAQLPVGVVAPALHTAVAQAGAGVRGAGRDGRRLAAEVDR